MNTQAIFSIKMITEHFLISDTTHQLTKIFYKSQLIETSHIGLTKVHSFPDIPSLRPITSGIRNETNSTTLDYIIENISKALLPKEIITAYNILIP